MDRSNSSLSGRINSAAALGIQRIPDFASGLLHKATVFVLSLYVLPNGVALRLMPRRGSEPVVCRTPDAYFEIVFGPDPATRVGWA